MGRKSRVLRETLNDFFIRMTEGLKNNGFSDKRIKSVFTILEFNSPSTRTNIEYYDVSVLVSSDYTPKLFKKYNFGEIIEYLSNEFDKSFNNTKKELKIKINFKLLNETLILNKLI